MTDDFNGDRPLERLLEEDPADLYENAPCGYLSTLLDGTIMKVNGTFLRWTGYTREDLLARMRFLDLLTVGGKILYETHFSPLLRMQGFVREVALDVICTGTRRMPVLVNAVQKPDERGRPGVVRITVFDVTERRRYERELLLERKRAEQAAREKAGLAAMISHDIRGPLSAILTATALLERTDPAPHQARFIRILRSSCDQALSLVNSVLDLGRLEATQLALRERVFDLRELVSRVTSGVRLAADQKPRLEVRAAVDDGVPPRLVGDEDKLAQVLTNLLTNAVKFTDEGHVSLTVELRELGPDAAALQVRMSDTGIGIPEDRLPHIFEEYTQASGEIAQKYGGTGLGLAISRRLLALYGSELHVASTVGEGTTFWFDLTLKREVDHTLDEPA